ncbi:MAG: acetyltransferase [Chitinophagales bacterium]|nr:MAG: acetyltransferase [Chitinophagales bacterium]
MRQLVFLAVRAIQTLLIPLSLLPYPILFVLSDVLFVVIFYVVRYRRKVVFENLRLCFPDKNEAEIKKIAKAYYHHLCDLMVENIKLFTLSSKQIMHRCLISGTEIIDWHFSQGKSVVVALGHCGNWELAGLATSLHFRQRAVALYKPIKNQYADLLMLRLRSKFGMMLIPLSRVRSLWRRMNGQPYLFIFITDQSPSNSETAYWTRFLNRDTAVYRGVERFARMEGMPVLFADIRKIKRGYYHIQVVPISDDAAQAREGEVTEKFMRELEKAILRDPTIWLWSHRRWKRTRPAIPAD